MLALVAPVGRNRLSGRPPAQATLNRDSARTARAPLRLDKEAPPRFIDPMKPHRLGVSLVPSLDRLGAAAVNPVNPNSDCDRSDRSRLRGPVGHCLVAVPACVPHASLYPLPQLCASGWDIGRGKARGTR
jgi:hypothetical protein